MSLERFTNSYSRTTGETLQFSDNETPTGTIDGANATFTLAQKPVNSSVRLNLNNVPLVFGTDYTLSGKTLTIDAGSIPVPGDNFLASYRF